MPRNSRGHIEGYQRSAGAPLGEQFPTDEGVRAYHGAPVSGIDEVKPGSEVGWVNHEVSHPNKVYAAVDDEDEAWSQATLAGSRKLGEYVDEHGTTPPITESPQPTVYDVTVRGNVEEDPEYASRPRAPFAVRGDRAAVNREIPMPVGAQGTTVPDYFGRTGSFAEGFRGTLLSEDTGNRMSGQWWEMPDAGPDPRLAAHVAPAIGRTELSIQAAQQMTALSLDQQGIPNFPVEGERTTAREMGEHPSPQLFNPSEFADISNNFPYGRPAGWESRSRAFAKNPIRW